MLQEYILDNDLKRLQRCAVDGRFISITQAQSPFEMSVDGQAWFSLDAADEVDLGDKYEDGLSIQIRNSVETDNLIEIHSAPVLVRKRRIVEIAEGSNAVTVTGGEVSISADGNNVNVTGGQIAVANTVDIIGDVSILDESLLNISTINFAADATTNYQTIGGDISLYVTGTVSIDTFSLPVHFDIKGLAAGQTIPFTGTAGSSLSIMELS